MHKRNKKESYQEEMEERIVSLIASLFGKKASQASKFFLYEVPLDLSSSFVIYDRYFGW